ncbi:neuronal acetylcholine receptor subunit alpha-7 [Aplysia californica]|uniref:Neuronal acetylcholine receptor subunit alpha-7 n=1 Tax=Aplysia californica TaxID=6500 RepID=A0ABM1A323_APLCA|nr:neuronal acetylcholine receptor subunit alpha-7 [Aplysia californica]
MCVALRLVFYISLISPSSLILASTYNDSARLYADILLPFDKRIQPVRNQSEPITVYFQIFLLNILNIDEVTQRVDLNAWINFSWVDELRTWNPSDYNGISTIHPLPLDTWRPRTLVTNSVAKRDLFEDDYSPLYISSDGRSKWFPGTIFSISCNLDIRYYPFDSQTCSMFIMTQDFDTDVKLYPDPSTVMIGNFKRNGEWDLVSTRVTASLPMFTDVAFSSLKINIVLKRKPLFFVVNILVPTMFISAISSIVFILPEDSGERASFAITVLLSLSVFLSTVSSQLPQNSENFPIIISYLFSLLVLNGTTVFAAVIQLQCRQKKKESTPDSARNDSHHDGPVLFARLKGHFQDGSVSPAWGSGEQQLAVNPGEVNVGQSFKKQDTEHRKTSLISDADVALTRETITGHFKQANHSHGNSVVMAYLKDSNVLLFVFINTTWLILTIYFLVELIYH